jgi:hypothetical protein
MITCHSLISRTAPFYHAGGDATLIHRTGRGQQVGRGAKFGFPMIDGRSVFEQVTSMMKEMMKPRRCAHCRRRFKPPATGRPPKFCRPACRQAAYLARKTHRPHPVTLLAADLAHVRVREWLRREIWSLLGQAGVVSAPNPPVEPPPRRSSKPKFRLVEPEASSECPDRGNT